jgi:hypothetical protein
MFLCSATFVAPQFQHEYIRAVGSVSLHYTKFQHEYIRAVTASRPLWTLCILCRDYLKSERSQLVQRCFLSKDGQPRIIRAATAQIVTHRVITFRPKAKTHYVLSRSQYYNRLG